MRTPAPHITTITILLISLLLSPLMLTAQTNLSDWSRLNAFPSGSKLSVKLKDGKKVEGTLQRVSDSGLSLRVKNADRELRRDDVQTVQEISKNSVKKATLIGLGLGAGAGAVAGIAGDAASDNGLEKFDNVGAAAVTILGAGVGALTGFLIGKSGNKKVLIYEAR